MYIAVTTDGPHLESPVSRSLKDCKYLLIVNLEDLSLKRFENTCDETAESLAKTIVDNKCEAVITGGTSCSVIEKLSGKGIPRFNGYGYSAKAAVLLMDQSQLSLLSHD